MYIEEFVNYLRDEKRLAPNSLNAYKRDVEEFTRFEKKRGIYEPEDISSTECVAYLNSLKLANKSASTINRKLASIRAYFNYLINMQHIISNPAVGIKSPKIERKELEVLSMEEIDKLLDAPDDSLKGKRDRAILEVLYATGIKVSELVEANVEDVNFRMGFITCLANTSKVRIVPLGRPARKALEEYVYDTRSIGLHSDNSDEKALFINYSGHRMTRQGVWKIIKEYGTKTGLEDKLTPNTIRNSFAVHMLQNGADLKSLQELMGHEDISATQMYLAATKNHIKDVYDRTHPRAK